MARARPVSSASAQGPRPEPVSHYCPGGREHGGGIGRMVGYIADAAPQTGRDHQVFDTRGPQLQPVQSTLRLLLMVGILLRARLMAPQRIHHFHIAGRGSTVRKLLLTRVARGLGCHYVLHLHDYDYSSDFLRRPPWLRRRIAAMFRKADRVVVLGRRDKLTAETMLEVQPQRIVVLHNAVPDPGSHPARAGSAVNVLFLGRLSPRKGVPELLEALASPALIGRDWQAVLAGDGPVAHYREDAGRLGLGPRLHMPGWLEAARVADLCRAADILVLPSHAEGLAMAVLEGLSHGLAVVTTRVGAHEEVITDQVTGLFVPVGDPAALAGALAALIDDPAQRARLAAQGRRLYEARFSMEGYMQKIEDTYAHLLAQPVAPAATL